MYKIFDPVTKYFKIKRVRVYDLIFGLHCNVTAALVIAGATIVSAKEYFGTPIDCITDVTEKAFLSTFCWVTGTYIVPGLNVGTEAASFGVSNEYDHRIENGERIYQRYYPWIVLFLFFQSIIFLLPSYLWKVWEGGRLQEMSENLLSVFEPEEWSTRQKELFVSYFSNKSNKDAHMWYAWKYFCCEFLNLGICMLFKLNSISKYFHHNKVNIYDAVFKIHCRITVITLIVFALIVFGLEYIGYPMECTSDLADKEKIVSSYCWATGTYIYPGVHICEGKEKTILGVVGPDRLPSKRIYQRYYPWIVWFLLFEAVSFFAPAYLWRILERKRLRQICENIISVNEREDWSERRREHLLIHFASTVSNDEKEVKKAHNWYAWKYFSCELFNLVICIFNILILNWFFDGFWAKYLPAIGALSMYDWKSWNEQSSVLFPKVAKCEFQRFGSAGSLQTTDALCVLPLNMLNDKIFAILGIWFIILTIISFLNFLYRIFVIASPNHRLRLLRVYLNHMPAHQVKFVFYGASIGDWFMLYQVGRNMNSGLFAELAEELYSKKKESIVDRP